MAEDKKEGMYRQNEYWPNGNIRTEVIRSKDPADLGILEGQPNIYKGGEGLEKSGFENELNSVKAEWIVSALRSDKIEKTHPTDPYSYIYRSEPEPEEEDKKPVYERIVQYDESGKLTGASVKAYDSDMHLLTGIEAQYDPETGRREKTVMTNAEWNEHTNELTETRTEYDEYFIPRERHPVITRPAFIEQDEENKNLRDVYDFNGDRHVSRMWIMGPNEDLAVKYRQIMADLYEGEENIPKMEEPILKEGRSYAIEVEENNLHIVRTDNNPYFPVQGDMIVDYGDEKEYFADISDMRSPVALRPQSQIKLIEENPFNIFRIEEPTHEAQMLAAAKNHDVLSSIRVTDANGEEYGLAFSPIQEKELLMEILEKDPSAAGYMDTQVERYSYDERFMQKVLDAAETACEKFAEKDNFLCATDKKIFIFSDISAETLPTDVSRKELNDAIRAAARIEDTVPPVPYVVFPSSDGNGGYDIRKYSPNEKAEHFDSPGEVIKMMKKDIKDFSFADIKTLEDVRKTLAEREGPTMAVEISGREH